MKLYHGTSSRFRSKIRARGIKQWSWASASPADAREFAEYAVQRFGGTEDVWEIELDPSQLSKAWLLGGKQGQFYKFHHKPVATYRLLE